MPRRKHGRDKPRGRRRNRKKGLPKLNTRSTWRIGQPRIEAQQGPGSEPPQWEQRREPFPESRALEDVLCQSFDEVERTLSWVDGLKIRYPPSKEKSR